MADRPVPQYVTDGARVSQRVERQYDEALALARSIGHPWYRCQSHADVASRTPDKKARRNLIVEAFSAAAEQSEANRVVTVSAWPLQVLAEDASSEELENELRRLNDIILKEPHPVRRADAFYRVADFLKNGPRTVFLIAVRMFAGHAHQAHGWKRDRSLRDMAIPCWRNGERSLGEALVMEIEGARWKRQALRGMQ